jgi:hypothetical protein
LVIISNRVALAEKGKQAGGGLVTGILDWSGPRFERTGGIA